MVRAIASEHVTQIMVPVARAGLLLKVAGFEQLFGENCGLMNSASICVVQMRTTIHMKIIAEVHLQLTNPIRD